MEGSRAVTQDDTVADKTFKRTILEYLDKDKDKEFVRKTIFTDTSAF
jgi:hypothetical protein